MQPIGRSMPGRQSSLRQRIAAKIDRSDDAVFLTPEFRPLGCERHVLRALRQLVEEGRLIRLGYGVYGRAEISQLTGKPMLAAEGGFIDAVGQTLDKLGVSLGTDGIPAGLQRRPVDTGPCQCCCAKSRASCGIMAVN